MTATDGGCLVLVIYLRTGSKRRKRRKTRERDLRPERIIRRFREMGEECTDRRELILRQTNYKKEKEK